jgi:radical SAM protein (TIGR01212 family)
MESTNQSSDPHSTADWRSAGYFYHSLKFFYNNRFGCRIRKLTLDAGCGCPNRDGKIDTLGCIFCDPQSFNISRRLGIISVKDQIENGIARLKNRYGTTKYVAYFQPGTNTYGPVADLEQAYREAIRHPDVVGLAVGTRPDCVDEPILDVLAEIAKDTWVVVEYGLQTIHNRTLDRIHRGHHYDAFLDAYRRTRQRGLDIGVHVILGLPGETGKDMQATARALAEVEIHSIKLHQLYAVRNTTLANQLDAGDVRLPEFDEYVKYVVDFLEETPERVVIERLCGDAPPDYLVGPSWCRNKAAVRPAVEAEFRRRGTFQGCRQLPQS